MDWSDNPGGPPRPMKRSDRSSSSEVMEKRKRPNPPIPTAIMAAKFLRLVSNSYEFDLSDLPANVEKLYFKIFVEASRGKVYLDDLLLYKDLLRQMKKRVSLAVYKNLFSKEGMRLFGTTDYRTAAYDGDDAFYLPRKTFKQNNNGKISFGKADFDPEIWKLIIQLFEFPVNAVEVSIELFGYWSFLGPNWTGIRTFLEILTSQEVIMSDDFHTFDNTSYRKSIGQICDEDASKEWRSGFEKCVRFAEDEICPEQKLVLTIDLCRHPFYVEGSLLKLILILVDPNKKELDNQQDNRQPEGHNSTNESERGRAQRRSFNEQLHRASYRRRGSSSQPRKDYTTAQIQELQKIFENNPGGFEFNELNEVAVVATHLPEEKQKPFIISRIAVETNARKKMIQVEGREISVYNYFLEKYGIQLEFPDLPLAVSFSKNNPHYYPLEVLKIKGGQRVHTDYISPELEKDMRLTLPPPYHFRSISRVVENGLKLERSPYLAAFEIAMKQPTPELVPLSILTHIMAPPIIEVGGKEIEPKVEDPAFFNGTHKFIKPADVEDILFITMPRSDEDTEMMKDAVENFRFVLRDHCMAHGMRFWSFPENWKNEICMEHDIQNLETIFKESTEARRLTIIVCVTQTHKPDCYDEMKLLEGRYKVQTMQLPFLTVRNMLEKNLHLIRKICRKFNIKCHGLNFRWRFPKMCQDQIVCQDPTSLDDELLKNTIYIGFDVIHGSVTYQNDRQSRWSGSPSVVGISYSLSEPCKITGMSYLEGHTDSKMSKIEEYFPAILQNYHKEVGRLPDNIVIYRVRTEMAQLSDSVEECETMKTCIQSEQIQKIAPRGYTPRFLMIAVQKHSQQRLYRDPIPDIAKTSEQNVPSGTLIDDTITTFGNKEFLLVSQICNNGTVRPIKYTILVNDMGWSRNIISHLTYYQAFGNQVSYKPPSVPAVLVDAENQARRGRNHAKTYTRKAGSWQEIEQDEGDAMDALTTRLNLCSFTNRQHSA